jgi:hypothetical protein
MPNLVTELLRDYQRNLLTRRRAAKAANSPATKLAVRNKLKWPPIVETGPHKPAPDHHLRRSHF